MDWQEFELQAPELAQFGWERFEKHRVVLLATTRKDGTPRISPLEVPLLVDGRLYIGMMYKSTKALDLLRDPRGLLHNAVTMPDGTDQEFKLRGRALPVTDRETDDAVWAAVTAKSGFPRPDRYNLFAFDIESAAAVKVEDDKMWTRFWPGRDEWQVREDS